MSDLSSRINKDYNNFDFFHLVSLLEDYFSFKNGTDNPVQSGNIRFLATRDIAFPASDIKNARSDGNTVSLILSFMGLCGLSSPLPVYFSEHIISHEEDDTALYDFLSIFNHRVYSLFYKAWKKHCFMTAAREPEFINNIFRLAGFIEGAKEDGIQLKLRKYIHLFTAKNRNARGLCSIISGFFGNIPVKIEENVGEWIEISEKCFLGRNSILGANTLIGDRIFDFSLKFRIVLGPFPKYRFENFLPGAKNIGIIREIVSVYTNEPLFYDIVVKLSPQNLSPVVIGDKNSSLGRNSSLGISDKKSPEISVTV